MPVRIAVVLFGALAASMALAADGVVERIGVPRTAEFAVEADVRFGAAGSTVQVDAGGRLELTADTADSAIQIKASLGDKTLASETERLKPEVRKGWGDGVEQDLAREAAAMTGWRGRWFRLKVDADRSDVWFWFDGRAIAKIPRQALAAEIVIRASGEGSIRQAASEPPSRRGAFQMVDLAGYANMDGPAVRGQFTVNGIPFYATRQAVDLSKTGLRIRRQRNRHTSLFQHPFNFISAMDGDPLTSLIRVPKRYYRQAWLLCAFSDPRLSAKATLRLARYRGAAGAFFADSEFTVPGQSGAPVTIPGLEGRFWLVPVRLDPGALQDVLAADVLKAQGNPGKVLELDAGVPWMEMELTRELRPELYCMLPLGPTSGVRIYGITLEESPVRMVATTDVVGSLFETGTQPHFRVWLENNSGKPQRASLAVAWRNREGEEARKMAAVPLGAAERRTERVQLPVLAPGKYDLSFQLRDAKGQLMVQRATTFAVLPPDTRRAERDSPFGLWSWGGAHLTPPNEIEAELMRRAGARFTLGVNYPSKHKFGIGTGTDSVIGVFYTSEHVPASSPEAARAMVQTMKKRGSNPRYWQIYWEDSLSSRHNHQFPPSLTGRAPMVLNDEEEARLKSYWDRAEGYARETRRELPREKLALGAFPNFTEEFLRRGFPKQYLDALSLEVTCYRMQPERPPATDDLNGLYFIQEWKKKYGYQGLDTIMVESMFHGTAPGYVTERDQANYYVRDFLLGLAYGVKLFGMSAMITDVSDDYYRTSWGNVGLCHRAPEPSPKESYVTYATMTSMIDQAHYAGYVETGTASVYALHFVRPNGANVYAMWTTRGTRPVTVELDREAGAEVVDGMFRRSPLKGTQVELSEAPVYLATSARLKRVKPQAPVYQETPPRGAEPVIRLNTLDGWRPRPGKDALIEEGNPAYPRRPGKFEFRTVTDSSRGPVVEVSASAVDHNPLLPMYGVLDRAQPLPIPGRPRRLGLRVKGNSGWGRVTFEVIDAKGERWTGVGGSEDPYGYGFINFDGWRWVEVDLPGQFRDGFPWPISNNWTATGGDQLVDYPLSLQSIVVEMRDHVVYVNQLAPVPSTTIRLQDLRAVY